MSAQCEVSIKNNTGVKIGIFERYFRAQHFTSLTLHFTDTSLYSFTYRLHLKTPPKPVLLAPVKPKTGQI